MSKVQKISKEKGLRWCRFVLIAVSVHANTAWALEPANADPPPQKPLETNLSVDVSELKADASYEKGPSIILDHILSQGPEVLEKSGLRSVYQDNTAKILIRLKWLNPQAYEYVVDFELFYHNRPTESTIKTFICKGCMEDEVIRGILERLPQAANIFAEAQENERLKSLAPSKEHSEPLHNENHNSSSAAQQNHTQKQDTTHQNKERACKTLCIAGWTTAISGAAMTATGIALLVRNDTTSIPIDATRTFRQKSTRPAGIAVTAVGATALASGITLLFIELAARKRQNSKKEKLSIYPLFTNQALGMGITSRF